MISCRPKSAINFLLFVFSLVFWYPPAFGQSSITYTHATGGIVTDFIEFRQKQFFGQDKVAKLPLPPGEWNSRLTTELKSNQPNVQTGVRTVLDQVVENKVIASLWVDLYPNANLNWKVSVGCGGDLIKHDRGNQISGYCHSLRATNHLTDTTNKQQATVRDALYSNGISWPERTLTFGGYAEQRGDFVLYFDLYIDPRFIGIDPIQIKAASFSKTLTSEIRDNKFNNVAAWYQSFASSLAASILKEKSSLGSISPPGPISTSLRSAWINYAENTSLALKKEPIETNTATLKSMPISTESAQLKKWTPQQPYAMN